MVGEVCVINRFGLNMGVDVLCIFMLGLFIVFWILLIVVRYISYDND